MNSKRKFIWAIGIIVVSGCILLILIPGLLLQQVMPGATRKNATANIIVFEDVNGNGRQDGNEGPLPNTLIVAHSNIHGTFTRQTRLSDAQGQATVNVTYTHYFDVGVLPPCGYTATTPNSLSVAQEWPFAKQRFGFQPQGQNPADTGNSLHFQLWHDVNGDGRRQADEPPLSGLTFALVLPFELSYNYIGSDYYGFDKDDLVLTTDETGQVGLDVGNFCGKIWQKPPKGWLTTMTIPESTQNDDIIGFTTQTGQTEITWGLHSNKPIITPIPPGHHFEFGFGGAYHPEGFGAWQVSLRSSGAFSVSHQVADVTDIYGPVTLTRAENRKMWMAILAADIPNLPPTFQRPGIPDETAYTFTLYNGDTTHTVEMWVDEAKAYRGVPPLVELIRKMVEVHTGKKMER